jgi:hypothetical protein
MLFINRSGQKVNISYAKEWRTWLSEPILMLLLSEVCVLYFNWLMLSTTYDKRKQI